MGSWVGASSHISVPFADVRVLQRHRWHCCVNGCMVPVCLRGFFNGTTLCPEAANKLSNSFRWVCISHCLCSFSESIDMIASVDNQFKRKKLHIDCTLVCLLGFPHTAPPSPIDTNTLSTKRRHTEWGGQLTPYNRWLVALNNLAMVSSAQLFLKVPRKVGLIDEFSSKRTAASRAAITLSCYQ